jgi:hypothetical protein
MAEVTDTIGTTAKAASTGRAKALADVLTAYADN